MIAWSLGGVKSFLERFGERCQERNQGSPSNAVGLSRSTVATPSSTHKSRLLQERLPVTQEASSTALLTQKQKMVGVLIFYINIVARVPFFLSKNFLLF